MRMTMISHMLVSKVQAESETMEMNNRIPGHQTRVDTSPHQTRVDTSPHRTRVDTSPHRTRVDTSPHQTSETRNGCTCKDAADGMETSFERVHNNNEKQQRRTTGDFHRARVEEEEQQQNGIDQSVVQPYAKLMNNRDPYQKEDNSDDAGDASELFPDSPFSEPSDGGQDSDDMHSDVSFSGNLHKITTSQSFVDKNSRKRTAGEIDTHHKAAKMGSLWNCYNQVPPLTLALNPRGSLLELAHKLRVANDKMWGSDTSNSPANITRATKPAEANHVVHQQPVFHTTARSDNVAPEKDTGSQQVSQLNNTVLKEKITAVGNQLWKVLLRIDPDENDTIGLPSSQPDTKPVCGPSLWPVLAATRDNPLLDYAELLESFTSQSPATDSATSIVHQRISCGLTPPLPLNDSQIENIESNAIDFVVKTKVPKLYAMKTAGDVKQIGKKDKVVLPQDFLPRKHKCPLCSYQTDNKSHLRRHQSSVHSAIKPYFCYVCNKDFSRTEKVKAHFLKMHTSIVYDPKLCRRNALPTSELSGRHRDSAGKFVSTSKLYQDGSECSRVGSPAAVCVISSPVSSHVVNTPDLKVLEAYQPLVADDSLKIVLPNPSSQPSAGIVDSVSETSPPFTTARQPGKKCPHCTYISRDMWHLKRHLSDVHSQQKAFSCPICCYSTSRRHRLVTHMNAHSILYCLYCAFNTDNLNEFAAHQRVCTQQFSATTFTCMFCGEQCTGQTQLQDHASSVHQSHFYVCQTCPFFTGNSAVFDSHKQEHVSSVANRYCNETFPDSAKVSTAIQPQHQVPSKRASKGNVGFFSCPHCDFTSKYRNVLRKHLTKHPGEMFVCGMAGCDYRTTDKSLLQQHTHGQHGPLVPTQSYPCPMCLRPPFKYKRSLEKHIQMHMETDDKCGVCGARFLLKAQLDTHMEAEHKTPHVEGSSEDASSDSSHSDDDTYVSTAVPQYAKEAGTLPMAVDKTLSNHSGGDADSGS